jgi:uncharacterized protein (DUF1015 family)
VQILPCGRGPAPRQAALELAPFRGVRYARDRVSGLAEVTSPPYDVIAHDIEDQLMAADPHNVVRLILPRPAPGRAGNVYDEAARELRQWQDERILVPDREPSLYVYEQAAPRARGVRVTQRGLLGAVRLSPPDAGVIRPHENVAPGPVAGRLALMEATQANLEPIFLLYDGSERGAAARIIGEAALAREALVDTVTGDGVRHRLWAVTDPAELAAIAADLGPRSALIADGHHRYAAYLRLQARRRDAGSGPGPWDYGLALLVDAAAYPPDITAIHRVIPGLAPPRAAELAKGAFTVRRLPGGTRQLEAALDELAAASGPPARGQDAGPGNAGPGNAGPGDTGPADTGPADTGPADTGARDSAFLVAGGGEVYLLTDPDPLQVDAAMPAGRSSLWRSLPASVLQELLMARVWGISDDDQDLRFVHDDAGAAVRDADETGGTAVICPSMSAWDVYRVAARGERVPRKSTSFGPKPRTGLVVRTFAQG